MKLRRLTNKPVAAVCDVAAAKTSALFFDQIVFPSGQFARLPGGMNKYFELEDFQKWMWFTGYDWDIDDEISLNPTNPRLMEYLRTTPRLRDMELVPICRTSEPLGLNSPPVEHRAFQAVIENFPVVDETSLSWKHVITAREDKSLSQSFVDLRLWVTSVSKDSGPEMISDLLALRMENYKAALKKHGIESINGALRTVLDPTKIATLSGVSVGLLHLGSPEISAIAASLLIGADFAVKVSDYMQRKTDLRNSYGEVAILYDLAKKLDA